MLSDELLARRAEIEQRVAFIDSEDYFQMLGVGREAQAEELKAAYFALVKLWHPDRLPRDLASMKSHVARVFGRLTEAYQTLTDSTQRADYVRVLGEGGGTPEDQEKITRTVDAALEFQKAEILLKKQDLAGAEDLTRRAAESDPEQPDYQALLAWIQALRRGDPPPLTEGKTTSHYDDLIEKLDVILRNEPRYERALFYRGMLLKRSGRLEPAIRDFRLAAEINPKNIDAVREVRLYQMRARAAGDQQPPPQGGGGLFGKLFKR
jgi:tetratricopeptide (TPR) repeat protein